MSHRLSIVAFTLVWAALGCQRKAPEDDAAQDLFEIGRACGVVQSARNRPPRSIDEIRQVLVDMHTEGVGGEPDQVLTSRDGQPYEIVYGKRLYERSKELLAFEKTGDGTRRFVLTVDREILQVDEAEFARMHRSSP